jgi:hypothetical protein
LAIWIVPKGSGHLGNFARWPTTCVV